MLPSAGCEKMLDGVGELSAKEGVFPYFSWKVPGFFDLPRSAEYDSQSPEFRFAGASWCLKLYPNGLRRMDPFIYIVLERLRSPVPEHGVFVTFGLQTSLGEEHRLFHGEHCFDGNHRDVRAFGKFTRSELEKRGFAPTGELTVYCGMILTSAPYVARTEMVELQATRATSQSASLENLQTDYKKLLYNGTESDVCLVVSGREFGAHKCILKARSPVFCAMFDHETEEKASGKVHIEDLDPDSFRDFLEYVYAGRVEDLSDDNVFGLYVAADKYDLQTLKSECLEYLRRCLSVDSFCDVMMLSLRYKEEELMDLAIDFFKKNMPKIIVTVKWQVFLSENCTKANELLVKAFVPSENKS